MTPKYPFETPDIDRRHLLLGLAAVPILGLSPGSGAQAATPPTGALVVPSRFTHPGLLYSATGLAFARSKVMAGERPWVDGWNALLASERTSLTAQPNPQVTIIRGGPGSNFGIMITDMQRALQCALCWSISGDERYAVQAVKMLNAWSSTMTQLTGNNDQLLAAGIYGYQWANAAELMRSYPGWAAKDIQSFQNWLLTHFYTKCSEFLRDEATIHDPTAIFSNWDICSLCALVAIAVFCDRADIYAEAIRYYSAGRGMGAAAHQVFVTHPGKMGQAQESGRDQGHATLSVSLNAALCEMAWNQGTDLYGFLDNRFLSGAEYVARSNLLDSNGARYILPFTPQYAFAADRSRMLSVNISGNPCMRPGWEIVLNHYVHRLGIDAPNVTAMVAAMYPEQQDAGGDQPSFGTLTHRQTPGLLPLAAPATCSGLTAVNVAGRAQLSWWGSVGASAYEVGRRSSDTSEFSVIATVRGSTTYTDAARLGRWQYAVRAQHAGVNGAWSPAATVALTGEELLRIPRDFANPGLQLHGGARLVAGRAGWPALLLAKEGAHANFSNTLTSSLGDFSLCMWVYPTAYAGDTVLLCIGRDDVGYMALVAQRWNRTPAFVMTLAGYDGEDRIEDTQPLALNRWVHLAVTCDGAGNGVLYRDGLEVGRNTAMTFLPFQFVQATQCAIGRDIVRPWAPNSSTLRGRVQGVSVVSRALSAREIRSLAIRGY